MSVVMATATNGRDARTDTKVMQAALADRSAHWISPNASATAALAAGGDTVEAAGSRLHTLIDGTEVAASAPRWTHTQLNAVLGTLAGTASPEELAQAVSAVTGDLHCVATWRDGHAMAYRGPFTARPLFYTRDPAGGLRVASQIRALRAADPSLRPDLNGLAAFLLPQLCDTTDSAWSGVHRLAPGHALTAVDGQIAVREISRVARAEVSDLSRTELVSEFRARLLTALRRRASGDDAVLLSGGIDSAALAAAASLALPDRPRGYSLTYHSPELAACDERAYVDAVAAVTGMAVTRLPADDLLPLIAPYLPGDEPETWTYAARNTAMLNRIASDPNPAGAVFAGEGGDELLLGQVFAVADRFARGDTAGAAAELVTFPDPTNVHRVVEDLLAGSYESRHARVTRALDEIPPWITDAYRRQAGLVDRLAEGYPSLTRPGSLVEDYSRTLIAEAGAAGRVHCGGWWEDTAARAGVHITYPFLDPDLAAWTWALPPELYRDKGFEKVVLREALPELVPEVAARRDKADARAIMRAGLTRAADRIRAVAHSGRPLVDLEVIDPTALLLAVDDYLSGRRPDYGPALWTTVTVDEWLTDTGDSQ